MVSKEVITPIHTIFKEVIVITQVKFTILLLTSCDIQVHMAWTWLFWSVHQAIFDRLWPHGCLLSGRSFWWIFFFGLVFGFFFLLDVVLGFLVRYVFRLIHHLFWNDQIDLCLMDPILGLVSSKIRNLLGQIRQTNVSPKKTQRSQWSGEMVANYRFDLLL